MYVEIFANQKSVQAYCLQLIQLYLYHTQRSSDEKITSLTDTVEVLQRFSKVGTSCGQLARLGFNVSETFYLDYDGLGLGKDLLIYGRNTWNLTL